MDPYRIFIRIQRYLLHHPTQQISVGYAVIFYSSPLELWGHLMSFVFWVDFEELDRYLRGVLGLGLTKLLTKNINFLAYQTDSLFSCREDSIKPINAMVVTDAAEIYNKRD